MKLDFETDEGIGTRATLGVIVLETDETLEPEFARIFIGMDRVALYHSRIPMTAEIEPKALKRMEQDIAGSARLLPPSLEFDVIGYGCTSASTVIGSEAVAGHVQSVCPQAQVTDPLAAIIAACQALGVQRLGLITPYVAEVAGQMQGKLSAAGLETLIVGSFEEARDPVVARITPDSIAAAAAEVAAHGPGKGGIDALVISCTNLRCLDVVPKIEAALGIPVIASNLAMAWHMLQLAGASEVRPEFGRLFALEGPQA